MGVEVELKRFALMENQVIEMELPFAPAKITDKRTASWDGLGQVELDAIEPNELKQMCLDAISEYFDEDLYDELMDQEADERSQYRIEMKDFALNLGNDE